MLVLNAVFSTSRIFLASKCFCVQHFFYVEVRNRFDAVGEDCLALNYTHWVICPNKPIYDVKIMRHCLQIYTQLYLLEYLYNCLLLLNVSR